MLAQRLLTQAYADVVVLGMPRGGVPVARQVADALAAPLDIIVVRKLGAPDRTSISKFVGGMLTVKGSREEKRETKKADYLRREIRYGAFERAIALPEGIKAEDLKATYHDGVLEVTAPMPKEAIPKEVKIQVEAPKGN